MSKNECKIVITQNQYFFEAKIGKQCNRNGHHKSKIPNSHGRYDSDSLCSFLTERNYADRGRTCFRFLNQSIDKKTKFANLILYIDLGSLKLLRGKEKASQESSTGNNAHDDNVKGNLGILRRRCTTGAR